MSRPAISSTNAINKEKRFFVEAEAWILERARSDKPTTCDDVKLRFKSTSHLSDKRINAVLRKILAKRRELAIATGITPKGVQTTVRDGFIYMVENLAYPGWVKAGMTTNVSSRLDEVRTV